MIKLNSIILILFLCCFSTNLVYAESLLYSHDFDDNTWGSIQHNATGGDSDTMILSSSVYHSSSYSARVNFDGGNNLQHIHYDGWQSEYSDEFFIRFWYFHDTNFKHDYNMKVVRLTSTHYQNFNTNLEFREGGNGGGDPDWFWNSSHQYWNNTGNVDAGGTCYNFDIPNPPAEVLTAGTWNKFELYVKLNTQNNSNGILKMWLNDVLVKSNSSVSIICDNQDPQSVDHKVGAICFPSNYADGPPSGTTLYYVDDFEIWVDDGSDSVTGTLVDGNIEVGGGDTTPPTLSTAVISTSGTTLTLTFDEAVTQGSGYNDSDWDIDASVSGNDIGITYVSGDTTTTHVYTIDSMIMINETVNIDFNGDTNSEKDGSGNDLAAITSDSVTNNSQYVTYTIASPKNLSGTLQ